MPTGEDWAEWARLCRVEAAKTTDRAVAQLLRKIAEEYDERARQRHHIENAH